MKQSSYPAVSATLLCAGLVALLSQVSVAVQTDSFHISVAIILFQILLFVLPDLQIVPFTVCSAAGVFLLRLVSAALTARISAEAIWDCAPELLFYLCFGLLFLLVFRRRRAEYRLLYAGPLALMDMLSNASELLVRSGSERFSSAIFLQIALVGLIRAGLAGCILLALQRYGIQLLRREDRLRYQKLLFMTADLKSELVWMEKGSELAERTMNRAFHLCRSLRAGESGPVPAEEALMIAKDIHEVKKDYALVIRGISSALEQAGPQDNMELAEIFRLLARSTEQFSKALGKQITCTCRCELPVRTAQPYALMSVFRNLLNNAAEAAPVARPAHLMLRAWAEGEDALFAVEDDCGGIPADRLDQIFTPGFSSKINAQTGEINRGLGLSIVKDLVEGTLNGTIAVRSEHGGSVFTIRIPAAQLKGAETHADLSC